MTDQGTLPDPPWIDVDTVGPAKGSRFPDVTLTNQNGVVVDLHEKRAGRRALVVFHRSAEWCPFCQSQLVEIQQNLDLRGTDVATFAISYDPVTALEEFATSRRITYDLLSDPDSAVIRKLGMENEFIAQQRAASGKTMEARHIGLPHPAVFELDEDGVIVGKHVEQTHLIRPSSSVLFGEGGALSPAGFLSSARVVRPPIAVTLGLDVASYFPGQKLWMRVQIDIADGFHIYGPPTGKPYQVLDFRLSGPDDLAVGAPILPAASARSFAGSVDEVAVYEGTVQATIPFELAETHDVTSLLLVARYQSCTDTTCDPPSQIAAAIALTGDSG